MSRTKSMCFNVPDAKVAILAERGATKYEATKITTTKDTLGPNGFACAWWQWTPKSEHSYTKREAASVQGLSNNYFQETITSNTTNNNNNNNSVDNSSSSLHPSIHAYLLSRSVAPGTWLAEGLVGSREANRISKISFKNQRWLKGFILDLEDFL